MPAKPNLPTLRNRLDPVKLVLVAALLVGALFVWDFARNRVIQPFDNVVTETLCITYGEEIGRTVIGYERSNRFGLVDRSEGYCFYGSGPDGEAPITVTIEDTLPGSRYRAAKIMEVIVQLGIVSIFLRLTIEPVLDVYRWIRGPQG